ncbi:MAG: sugar phosphate isomerase/epimerase family protein [Candidatus Bathyarchaeia archaeon]
MPKPAFGLSMLYTLSRPFSIMLQELRKSPTKHVEIVDEGLHALNKRRVAQLGEIAASHDLRLSMHAPFADLNIASPSKPILNATMKRLEKSLAYAAKLNAYLWVFHPGNKSGISSFYPEEDWKQNLQSSRKLHTIAEDYGVAIAMENLPEKYNFILTSSEDFMHFYEETSLNDIGIVLDTGHANLENQIQPFLQQLSQKIVHIHVSDNHGTVDEHLGLGQGNVDWQRFAATLKEISFSGTILTESVYNAKETLQKLTQLFA